MNSQLTPHVLSQLSAQGVREYCICPGARNASLVAALSNQEYCKANAIRTYFFYEERSAAFFALGRAHALRAPVAVVTTSGTAAGELLPATMEAFYTGIPLVLVTADRPRSFRGSGAPQCADQVGIFGTYARTIDLEGDEQLEAGQLDLAVGPVHLNLCYEDPRSSRRPSLQARTALAGERTDLSESRSPQSCQEDPLGEERATAALEFSWSLPSNPIFIVGTLLPEERESVAKLLETAQAPVFLESPSGLREHPSLQPFRIFSPDQIMHLAEQTGYGVDGVIRIGGVPTLRLWRDLEEVYKTLPVLSLSRLPLSGLSRPSQLVTGDVARLASELEGRILQERGAGQQELSIEVLAGNQPRTSKELESLTRRFLALSQHIHARTEQLFEQEPLAEPSLVAKLSRAIPIGSRVYLGNSLPIREWDLAATACDRGLEVWASRGLNGIDGQVSTFLGFALGGKPGVTRGHNLHGGETPGPLNFSEASNWAMIGDLTALYDLAGPWILPQMVGTNIQIAVINNGGGKIFSRMFPQPEFQNQHQIRLKGWAELWGMGYEQWSEIPEDVHSSRNRILEILPDEAATVRFWQKYERLFHSESS